MPTALHLVPRPPPDLTAAVAALVDAVGDVRAAASDDGRLSSTGAGRSSAVAALSPRERDVLALMADGWANAAIADQLCINAKTVETHVSSVFSKLGLRGDASGHRRVQAVLLWWGRSVGAVGTA